MARRFLAHRAPTPTVAAPAVTTTIVGTPSRSGLDSARPAPGPANITREIGGPAGPEPTRYGDWERKGICVDF